MKNIKIGMLLALIGAVISCGPGQAKSEKTAEKVELKFPMEYKSDKEVVDAKDVVYNVAMITSSPFKGVFSTLHYQDDYDGKIIQYIAPSIFWTNEDFEALGVEGGLATLESIDSETKTITIKFKEGLKWSDGEPLGVDDLIYTVEVLGHPDYTGVRYSAEDHEKIIGMKEYHEGKAKSISGLEKVSDTELKIHLKEIGSKEITIGGSITGFSELLPKHYLKDIPMKDLDKSDKVRKNPLSYGEYVISNIVPGESVEFTANENYYLGKPNIEKVVLKTLTPQLFIESIKAGEYFSYLEIPQETYEKYKDFDNLSLIGRPDLYYQYLGFNLGHYDKDKEISIQDRDTPLQDIKLRKALAYAMPVEDVATAYYNGLRQRANGLTPPIFKKYYNQDLKGYPYDVEQSKKLLEEAGYKDTNNDGIVDKDGKNLSLQLAFMSGSDVAEPIAQSFIQAWKEIGIDVKLTTGRLLEFQLFYEKVQANSDDIDMWIGAWGVGTSLDPSQTYAKESPFNFTRYVDEKNDKLLAAIGDIKGLTDPNYKPNAYKEWESNFIDQAVIIPVMFRYIVTPINKSIKYSNVFLDTKRGTFETELVSKTPQKASN